MTHSTSTDTANAVVESCSACGGPLSAKRIILDGRTYHEGCISRSSAGRESDPISAEEYFRGTLKVIAHWSEVDLSGEWETGLRGIIRSITDAAKEVLSAHPEGKTNPGAAKAEPATIASDLDGGDARPNKRLDSSDRGHLLGVAQPSWRPIETAPKDGTPMLLTWWDDDTQDMLPVTSGFWSRLSDRWYSEISSSGCRPTHWMPLPGSPLSSTHQPCPGCDGHECDEGCAYPGAISSHNHETK